ncbi:hypothetical protein PN836_015965 [Ningiella sp. W23]|uniref:hypothetical protein n=1 Tax=Ningiella sp. W23 TaxID=3023715 RepID=UPI003756B4EA
MTLYKKTFVTLALLSSLWFAGNAQASLIGDAIDLTLTGDLEIQDLGVIVSDDVEFLGGDIATQFGGFFFIGESIDIGASSIIMDLDLPLGENGFLVFSSLDLGADITSATLTSNNDAVTQENLSFTANSVSLDLADWFFASGEALLQIDLGVDDIVVEANSPSVLSLLLLLGCGIFALRKR